VSCPDMAGVNISSCIFYHDVPYSEVEYMYASVSCRSGPSDTIGTHGLYTKSL